MESVATLETLIPQVRAEVDRPQKRYKPTFNKKVRYVKHVPKQGEWVLSL